jgi:hypothetical protein
MTYRHVKQARQERLAQLHASDPNHYLYAARTGTGRASLLTPKGRAWRQREHSEEVHATAREARFAKCTAINLELRRQLLARPDYCARCWLRSMNCVCALMPTLAYPHRLLLSMHSKGALRALRHRVAHGVTVRAHARASPCTQSTRA